MKRTFVLSLVITLAGCAGAGGGVPSTPDPIADPIGSAAPAGITGAWQLARGTVDGSPLPLLDDYPVTTILDASSIGGTSACNTYGGSMTVTGTDVAFGDLSATNMACVENAAMELEAAYLAALGRVRSAEVSDDQLALRGDGVDLRFDRQPEPPTAQLVDTTWILETLLSGDVASTPNTEVARLELRSDGSLSGSTGCRTFEGRWTEQGAQILATQLQTDETECPADLAVQDDYVLDVIGDGFTATIDGQRLTLEQAGGAGLVYRAQE